MITKLRALGLAVGAILLLPATVSAQSVLDGVELTLPVILVFAALDAINPCVIGVLILLLAVLLKTKDRKLLLANGLAYAAGVYFTYLIAGLTLLEIFNQVRQFEFVADALYLVIGGIVLIGGLLEIKDFFWYGRWFSLAIPKRFTSYVENKVVHTHASLWAAASFGFVVTLIELPCTGAPYLAILALMSQGGLNYVTGLPMLLLYNLVFVGPLLVIIAMAYYGTSLDTFKAWKTDKRGTMRLVIGLTLYTLGVWIMSTVHHEWFAPLAILTLGSIVLMAIVKYVFGFGRHWNE